MRSTAAIFDGDGGGMLQLADASDRRDRDGSYGQLNYAFPAIRCLDSQDDSVRAAEKRLVEESRQRADLGSVEWSRSGLSAVAGQVRAQATRRSMRRGRRRSWSLVPQAIRRRRMSMRSPWPMQLSSAVLVTFDGEGHLAYGQSGCVKALVDAYLVRRSSAAGWDSVLI